MLLKWLMEVISLRVGGENKLQRDAFFCAIRFINQHFVYYFNIY